MTEAEWQCCEDPQKMLEFLGNTGRASDRKLRLFACASCRRVWSLLTDERSRRVVEVAERFVDGWAVAEELRVVYRAARDPAGMYHEEAAAAAAHEDAGHAAAWASEAAAYGPDEPAWRQHFAARRADQAALLRDLFGPLPFRKVRLDAAWLQWNDGTVKKLAQVIYDERSLTEGTLEPARLAVVADALEEAGCGNEEVLFHLRQQGGIHVRGCWVIDLLLGKE